MGSNPTSRRGLGRQATALARDERSENRSTLRSIDDEFAATVFHGERRSDQAPAAEREYHDGNRDRHVQQAIVVGTDDNDEEWSDDRPQSVPGVGDAQATTTPARPRAYEQGDEREVHATETQTEKEDRREKEWPLRRKGGTARPDGGDQQGGGEHGSAREAFHREPADGHAKEGANEIHAEDDARDRNST